MKRFNSKWYSLDKIRCTKNAGLCYVRDPDGYLYAQAIWPTRIKAADLPEHYIYGRYYKRWGYLSAKGVKHLLYIPCPWGNHLFKDDCLLVSYDKPIQRTGFDHSLEFDGVDFRIYGNEILEFLKGAKLYSGIDISDILSQIQTHIDYMKDQDPRHSFDLTAYMEQPIYRPKRKDEDNL